MAMDDLFRLNNVLQAVKDNAFNHALITCVVKNNKRVFGWEKVDAFVIESATIMRDFADGEARVMIVIWVEDLENAQAESLLREFNRKIDGLLRLFEDRK